MPSPKKWLQPSTHGDKSGGADSGVDSGATGSQVEEAALEEEMPGTAEEQLEGTSVAGDPNEGINPNADMVENAAGERRAVSVSPKPGEKRHWDETGGIDRELGATVLRVLLRHGYQLSTSTSGRMVDQEIQTNLSGAVLQASRNPLNKIKEGSSASSMRDEGGDVQGKKGVDSSEAAPTAEYAMDEEEILEMEVERFKSRKRMMFRKKGILSRQVMGQLGSDISTKMGGHIFTAWIREKLGGHCRRKVKRWKVLRWLSLFRAMNWSWRLHWVLHRLMLTSH